MLERDHLCQKLPATTTLHIKPNSTLASILFSSNYSKQRTNETDESRSNVEIDIVSSKTAKTSVFFLVQCGTYINLAKDIDFGTR